MCIVKGCLCTVFFLIAVVTQSLFMRPLHQLADNNRGTDTGIRHPLKSAWSDRWCVSGWTGCPLCASTVTSTIIPKPEPYSRSEVKIWVPDIKDCSSFTQPNFASPRVNTVGCSEPLSSVNESTKHCPRHDIFHDTSTHMYLQLTHIHVGTIHTSHQRRPWRNHPPRHCLLVPSCITYIISMWTLKSQC